MTDARSNIGMMSDTPFETIAWEAYEHEHIERGSDWYWALGVIVVCAALTSLLFGNALFALLILAAGSAIAVMAHVPPELHSFEITDKGIQAGDTLHRYEEIISFWVEEESKDQPLLLIDTTKFLAPNLIVPLDGLDPERVREALRSKAKEVPMKEPLAHKILEFFGF